LRARRAEGYTCWLSERGLAPQLGPLEPVSHEVARRLAEEAHFE
jgi:hypothetical protein